VWGHVGVVYQDPISKLMYVWETQIPVEGTWWTLTNSLKSKGTRLTPLYRYLARCAKPLCVRPISSPVDCHRFADFVQRKWDEPFEFSFVASGANRVFADMFNVPMPRRRKRSGRYCAELIAETYAYLGVFDFGNCIDKTLQPDTMIPRDYSQHAQRLPLAPGWTFGEETLLGCASPHH
jgi:hypothetical protein